MIYESWLWKKELKKELYSFRRLISRLDLSDEPGVPDHITLKVEKFFFVSAFITRKLHEANKLSDELTSSKIPVLECKRINKSTPLHFMNNHRIDEFYDLDNWTESTMGIVTLCNFLIHSFIFKCVSSQEEDWEKKTIGAILVNSDRSKDSALYYVALKDFFTILQEVIKDNVTFLSIEYDEGVVKKVRKSREHSNNHNSSSKNSQLDTDTAKQVEQP